MPARVRILRTTNEDKVTDLYPDGRPQLIFRGVFKTSIIITTTVFSTLKGPENTLLSLKNNRILLLVRVLHSKKTIANGIQH